MDQERIEEVAFNMDQELAFLSLLLKYKKMLRVNLKVHYWSYPKSSFPKHSLKDSSKR
jgi:hypothetical protein